MMNDELICNGVELDLASNSAFPLTFSVADAKDPSRRKRTHSTSFTLEATSRNKMFFQDAFNFHLTGDNVVFDPTKRVNVIYKKKGIVIIQNGILQLKDVTITSGIPKFKVQVYSEDVDAFLALKSLKITDLDWSNLNHTLTRQAIKDSWTTASGSGYRYPMMIWRPMVQTMRWRVTDLVPYVHMKEVIDKIFDYIGIKYTSTFFNTTNFKNILFGFGGGEYITKTLGVAEATQRQVILDNGVIDQTRSYPWQGASDDYTYSSDLISPASYVVGDDAMTYTIDADALGQWVGNGVEIQVNGNYKFNCTGSVKFTSNMVSTNPQYSGLFAIGLGAVTIHKNGIEVARQDFTTSDVRNNYDVNNTATYPTKTDAFDLTAEVNCQSGDIIDFRITPPQAQTSGVGWWGVATLNTYTETVDDIKFQLTTLDTQVTDNSDISMTRFLPDMTCSDFLMGVFRQFNLIMTEVDELTGLVSIEPEVNFYKQTSTAWDVTQLVDHSKPIEITASANSMAKITQFVFKKKDEYDAVQYFSKWEKEYGDYTLNNPSYFATKTDKIELPWSNIVPFDLTGQSFILPRFVTIDGNNVKPNKGAPRIAMWNGMKKGAWQLCNNASNTYDNLTFYPSIHHFNNWENPNFDLNFQLVDEVLYTATRVTTKNCYNLYYSRFYNELLHPNGRFVNLYLKLNEQQVKNRDFSRLLMINGVAYRMNVLGAFDSNVTESTKVELIKVLDAVSGRKVIDIFNGKGKERTVNVVVYTSPPNSNGVGAPVIVNPAKYDISVGVINKK